MHRTIFICSTILTLLATTHSKSVQNDEEIESTTSQRLATTVELPVIYEPETDEKQSAKRSLLILMPVDENREPRADTETQDIVGSNQKTKRCKTASRGGSPSMLGERTNPDNLGSRHLHSYNDEGATKYLAKQKPRLQLVPLKKPDAAAKRDPTLRANEEHAANRGDNSVMKAIRGKLQSRSHNAGAPRGSFLRKTIDDDEYVCYCREKANPGLRKDAGQDFASKPSPSELLTRRLKPLRKNNDKLLGESRLRQNQVYRKPQRQPFLHALYPDARQYLPTLLPNHVSPILQQKGHEKVPYVPYFYQIDPELAALPGMIHSADPTKVNVPIHPVSGSDSIVGQPNRGHRLQDDRRVGQRVYPSSVSGEPAQRFPGTIPATSNPYSTNTLIDPHYSTKIDEGSAKNGEDPNVSDYNLQSGHSTFPKYTTLASVDGGDRTNSMGISGDDAEVGMEEGKEMSSEDPPRDGNSAMGGNAFETSSSNDSKTDFSGEYETTDRGTADYSEVGEVNNARFESNDHPHGGGASSFDKFYTHGSGSTSPVGGLDYDANARSRLNPAAQTLMGSDEIATEMGEPSGEEQQSSPSEDFEYHSSPNGASYFENEAGKHRQKGNQGKGDPVGEGQACAIDSKQSYAVQPNSNDPDYRGAKGFGNAEETPLITGGLASPSEAGVSRKIDDKGSQGSQSGEEFFDGNRPSESPEMEDNGGPLGNDYGEENFGSGIQPKKNQDPNEKDEEEDPAGESSMDETMGSVDPESDSGTSEDTINMNDNEKSMVNSGIVAAGRAVNPSDENLPFCDNMLLQKAIKTVINNFATDPAAEEMASARTVSSTGGELLQEVLNVPNLRSIVSMPPIERTILDKVKNLLARVTGVPRRNFDGDWPTNVIRDNLRNMMAAAPAANGELPPMTVAEHQFKDGKWVTNLVTLGPTSNETVRPPSVLERLRAAVKSLLRDPAVGLQAAKLPTVQNMIVQSVQKTFKPEPAASRELLDDSVVQAALDKELSLMEMEDTDATTIDNAESDAVDVTNMDMNKLLEIAKSEAGMNGDAEKSLVGSHTEGNGPVRSGLRGEGSDASGVVNEMQCESGPDKEKPEEVASSYWKDVSLEDAGEKGMTNSAETSGTSTSIKLPCEGDVETVSPTTEPFSYDLVGAARNSEFTQHLESSSTEAIVRPTVQTDRVTGALKGKETPKAGKEPGNRELESTSCTEKVSGTSKYKSISTETPFNIVAAVPASADENRGNSEEAKGRTGGGSSSGETYLGRISAKKNNNNRSDDVRSLRNSELYYVGDGVKLPLEIRKLDDGSYALSISRKICEQLLDKKCPCCVPVEGRVVRTVRTNAETGDAEGTVGASRTTKRITKRESFKSISPGEREKYDSAGDSLQIFSMPVETFARRYNLSLNLEKVQAPWNFEAKRKIDERLYSRAKNSQNKGSNADANRRHDLFSVHGIPENANADVMVRVQRMDDHLDEGGGAKDYKYRSRRQRQRNFNTYRYERDIDEPVNKRAEIVKDVLHWLREMILHARSE